MMSQAKRKIAIIGGGVASITAAYALTEQPGWQTKYDITVYQRGWRLGGKCASGRNREIANRIEEHGLHIWAGFYDNAFRLMRSCYDELVAMKLRSPEDPLGTLEKALKPLNAFILGEEAVGDPKEKWRPWYIEFPGNKLVPGSGGVLPQPFDYFKMVAKFLTGQIEKVGDALPLPRQVTGAGGYQSPFHQLLAYAQAMPADARLHTGQNGNELKEILEGIRIWLEGIKPGSGSMMIRHAGSISSWTLGRLLPWEWWPIRSSCAASIPSMAWNARHGF
ncbi:NAD(P)-binding protein [Rhizobium sp. RCAM05973]|uniref:NAD(P)-binding protein n=1 Tax=Rhizobium sp. RCAM05973 TaxID=2994066 RepID=UPI0032B78C58